MTIGRDGRHVGGDVSGDEAAWRDLIARYEIPAASDAGSTPWPERENLEFRPRDPSPHVADAPAVPEPGSGPDEEEPPAATAGPSASGPSAIGPSAIGPSAIGPAAISPGTHGNGPPGNGIPGSDAPGNGAPGNGASGNAGRRGPAAGGDRTRVIRHASPVPRPSDADAAADEGDRYVPPPPPPLPKLDSVGKGAWTALFGGPGYLVLATFLGWQVSSWAALAAVAAFVGGFAMVIVRMGDGPSRGDGPDNGAVL